MIDRLVHDLAGSQLQFAHRYQMRFECGAHKFIAAGSPADPTVQKVDQLFEIAAERTIKLIDQIRADAGVKMLRMLNVDVFRFVHKRLHFVVVGNGDVPGA